MTSICAISNVVGTLVGIIFNVFFVPDDLDKEYKSHVSAYLLAEAILVVCFSLPCILLLKSKPSKPPSISQSQLKIPPFMECMKMLIYNRAFILLFTVCSLIVGYFNFMGTIINKYYALYSITNTQTSIFGGLGNILGLVSAIIVSIIIDKYKKYKKVFLILIFLGFLSQVVLTFASELWSDNSFVVLVICFPIIAICSLPVYSTGMDYVIELTYPVGELISGGFVMTGAQLVGIAMTFLSNYFTDVLEIRYLPNVLCCGMFLLSFITLLFLKEELIRNNKDKEYNPLEQNLNTMSARSI